MSDTCTIFDGLDGLDCDNEADEYGLCERHGGFTDDGEESEQTTDTNNEDYQYD